MKYQITYTKNKNTKNLDNIEIIEIQYRANDKTLEDFIRLHQKDQRIMIEIQEHDNVEPLIEGNIVPQNITIKIPYGWEYSNKAYFDMLTKVKGFTYCYSNYITDIDFFTEVVNAGVSDIIIGGALGFHAKSLSKITKEKGIFLHLIPNVNQRGGESDAITGFYVLPADVPAYEDYVDYFDIVSINADIILDAYRKNLWFGDLSVVITGLPGDVLDGRVPNANFGKTRVDCGKRCAYGARCRMCYIVADLGKTLIDAGLWVKTPEPAKEDPIDMEMLN